MLQRVKMPVCKNVLLKGRLRLHPKIKILSSFTHPQVVANLDEFISAAEHKAF